MRYEPWVLRCLFHPLVLVAPLLKLAGLFGARDPRLITWLASIPTAMFSTAAIGLTAALARRFGLSPRAARAATLFYAFAWLPLAYGASPFPRPISTALLLAAFLLADSPSSGVGPALAAGLLAGAAFAVRWSEGVVVIPLCGWALWRSRSAGWLPRTLLPAAWRKVLGILGGFVLGTLLFAGVTDWLTWGAPLQSLTEYFRIMYAERPATEDQPLWDYLYTAPRWAGPVLLLLLIPAWKERRARPAMALLASIVVLLSLFSHKEWRYLQVAVPFLSIAAAAGWERLWTSGRRVLAILAVLLATLYGIERSVSLLSNRSASETDAARWIGSLRPRPRVLAFLQQWAYGEHLYLGNDVEMREIEYHRPIRPREIREAAADADVAAVYAMFLDDSGRRELERLGFRQIARFQRLRAYECLVFGRGPWAKGVRPPN